MQRPPAQFCPEDPDSSVHLSLLGFPVLLYLFFFVIYKFVLSNIGNNLFATVL